MAKCGGAVGIRPRPLIKCRFGDIDPDNRPARRPFDPRDRAVVIGFEADFADRLVLLGKIATHERQERRIAGLTVPPQPFDAFYNIANLDIVRESRFSVLGDRSGRRRQYKIGTGPGHQRPPGRWPQIIAVTQEPARAGRQVGHNIGPLVVSKNRTGDGCRSDRRSVARQQLDQWRRSDPPGERINAIYALRQRHCGNQVSRLRKPGSDMIDTEIGGVLRQ